MELPRGHGRNLRPAPPAFQPADRPGHQHHLRPCCQHRLGTDLRHQLRQPGKQVAPAADLQQRRQELPAVDRQQRHLADLYEHVQHRLPGMRLPGRCHRLPETGRSLEVAPGVRWVRMRLPFALDHINLWLLDDGDRVVVIDCGYASPDGTYKDNEILASNRARCFKEYMHTTYAPEHDLYKVSSVPEDWDGLVELLQRHPMNHGDEVLSLIARTGIFEGREKQLMDMHGGTVYRELLKSYFPQLRRIRITVGYEARAFNIEEAASLIYTHPRLLSLQEMYRVAAFYRPGTEQYREIYEIAAYHFPDDVLANINAASAVIMAGDPVSARQYLNKVADDPRAWNDFGVLAYLEGDRKKAEKWFRKALGIEPEKARKNLKKMKYEE